MVWWNEPRPELDSEQECSGAVAGIRAVLSFCLSTARLLVQNPPKQTARSERWPVEDSSPDPGVRAR
jgi:hypothetical protein